MTSITTPYKLSQKANSDLQNVYHRFHRRYGEARAEREIRSLVAQFERLAESNILGKMLGKSIDHIFPGFCRFDLGKHSIYYRKDHDIIFIVRVLQASNSSKSVKKTRKITKKDKV